MKNKRRMPKDKVDRPKSNTSGDKMEYFLRLYGVTEDTQITDESRNRKNDRSKKKDEDEDTPQQ